MLNCFCGIYKQETYFQPDILTLNILKVDYYDLKFHLSMESFTC